MALALEDFKKSVGAAIIAGSLAFTPATAGANDDDVLATPVNVETPSKLMESAYYAMRQMRHYSENVNTQGIGIFINLQKDGDKEGVAIGQQLIRIWSTADEMADYRINQSQGTTTDITFYLRGKDYTVNIADLKTSLPALLQKQRGMWAYERSSGQKPRHQIASLER